MDMDRRIKTPGTETEDFIMAKAAVMSSCPHKFPKRSESHMGMHGPHYRWLDGHWAAAKEKKQRWRDFPLVK